MNRKSILVLAISLFGISCNSAATLQDNDLETSEPGSVSPYEIVNLLCGPQESCFSRICEEFSKCPISISLSNRVVFGFVKTNSECEGCNTETFPPEKGIGKCIEYEITDTSSEWIVRYWVSDHCSFRYSDPTKAMISVEINKNTLAIVRITPTVEYIQDPRYCRVDEDCECLSGSGVQFIGCGNYLYASLNWSGYYSGDACICKSNQCVEKHSRKLQPGMRIRGTGQGGNQKYN